MSDIVTIIGTVATAPNTVKTDSGLAITHFRLASNNRRFDRSTQGWVDGESNFYSVSAFRQTAHNVLASLGVGDRVVVTGRLKVKEWSSGDRRGVTAEIDVDALGHDLTWGRSDFTKVARNSDRQPSDTETGFPPAAELASAGVALGHDEVVQPNKAQSGGDEVNGDQVDAAEGEFDSETQRDNVRVGGEPNDSGNDGSEVDVARSGSALLDARTPF
jgi:single-strand DNA-binding protein